jgi:diamine N-acetyltransferase
MLEKVKEYKMKHNNLKLIPINTDNYWEIGWLELKEEQKDYVGDNFKSMAYAYATVMEGKYAKAFGIYDGDESIGFLLIGHNSYDFVGCPKTLKHSYDLWRIMIDKDYQNKGYGKDAVKLALDYILTFPDGEEDIITTSYVLGNEVAKHIYESFGFVPNGDNYEDEITLVLKVK